MSAARLATLIALTLLAGTAAARSTSQQGGTSAREDGPAAQVPDSEQPPQPAPPATTPPDADDPVLASLKTLLEDARKAQAANDHALARARITQAIERALGELGAREDAPALELVESMGSFAHGAGELRSAERAQRRVLEVRSRTLPEDHPDLQKARGNLAITMYSQGDLARARALEEQVLEVRSRTLPEDHPELQEARFNLAVTMRAQGDLAGARALQEQVLAVFSRTLPEDHPHLQAARGNLANTMRSLGDLPGARALEEQALAVFSRTLPEDHPDLQKVRNNLARTMVSLGDLAGARPLQEQVLAVRSRTLPEDHPDLQIARQNLALTIKSQGDLAGARPLQEQVLAVRSRTLPEDHPELQEARGNLANTMYSQGDLVGARELQKQVLEVRSRTLPEDHPNLQAARGNLANTMATLGDLAGARALQEQVLEVLSRTFPEHSDLQAARLNLAGTIREQGDLAGARALQEHLLEVFSRTLPEDHPHLLAARESLALTMASQGDLAGARALQEQVLEVRSRTLPEDHPDLQSARLNLAGTIKDLGDLAGARTLFERVLEVRSRTLPEDHPHLQNARKNLAWTLAQQLARAGRASGGEEEGEEERMGRERCAQLIESLCRSQSRAARAALLESSVREAEARCAKLSESLSDSLSFAGGLGVLEPSPEVERACFVLSETTRGAALACAAIMRRAASAPRWKELREELRARSDELASLVQKGATYESFHQTLARREEVERELVSLAREASGGTAAGLDFDLAALGRSLGNRDAVVAYRRYRRSSIQNLEPAVESASGSSTREGDASNDGRPTDTSVESLCAFVVRSPGGDSTVSSQPLLTLVELGPIEPIEKAVREWREGLGVVAGRGVGVETQPAAATLAEEGDLLRRIVLDPLAERLAGATRLIVVLDDVLHLVPFDALPEGGDPHALVGDHLRIETRATLTELLVVAPEPTDAGGLVAVGEVSFDSKKRESEESEVVSSTTLASLDTPVSAAARREMPGILRGSGFGGFGPLPATGAEVEALAASFTDQWGSEAEASILLGAEATRERLIELAPKARWLHVATHGWFAPESIQSWADVEPLDRSSGLGQRLSGEEQVKGMSPMLLCGLALAGANLREDAVGRAPGLVTAEEIAALDLSSCELAVLSACDTNVGERRAGQGVASLQKALQMAGAKSVITSLWKVPDEATRELMADFYRRLWVEKKPKHRALWEAKMRLRDAVDERGEPRYSTRDWAAWVLTGAQE